MDILAAGEVNAAYAWKRVVISKSFPGSDSDVSCRFMDVMAWSHGMADQTTLLP